MNLLMVRTFVFSLFLSAALFTSGCTRTDVLSGDPCPGAGAFVKKADNLAGTVFYNSIRKIYGIQVATSMDSADIGVMCNLPAEYQKAGLKVRFSGNYYTFDKPVTQPAGYNTFYLTVQSIKK